MDITEKTKLPLFAVLISVPTLVFGLWWIFGVAFEARAATTKNLEQDVKIDSQTLILVQIRDNIKDLESEIKLLRRVRGNTRQDTLSE